MTVDKKKMTTRKGMSRRNVLKGAAGAAAFAAGSIYLAVRILNTDKMLTAHLSFRRAKKIK